ncbi:MAG TPA: hypothetical protein DDW52_06410 [Planctomycetaceae bacterium]|nr:hypothetical protein [Planctomycetaceae bacterium]
MESILFWLIIASVGGLFMAFANGSNDVANSFASAVGAKAITIRQATLIAGIMNFLGAAMLGGIVSARLITGLIDASSMTASQYVAAMLAVLFASATFVLIATFYKLPVSSSHSIVGSLIGVSAYAAGWEGVSFGELGKIISSWFISPVLAAISAYLLLRFIRRTITRNGQPGIMLRLRYYLPFVLALAVCVFAVLLMKKSLKKPSAPEVVVAVAADTDRPEVQLRGKSIERFAIEESPKLPELKDALKRSSISFDHFFHQGWGLLAFALILIPYAAIVSQAVLRGTTSHLEDNETSSESVFRRLQVGTSSYVAFAHGANDVANAIAPAYGVFLIYMVQSQGTEGTPTAEQVASIGVPLWLLVLGGGGIALGIGLLGHRVIETLGEKVTKLNNTRGFCVDFSSATTVVGASLLGLPVSSTHAATGAIMGSGVADKEAVKWKTLVGIFSAWVITLPAAAAIAILYYILLSFVVG